MINPEQLLLNLDLPRRTVWHRKLLAFCLTVPILLLAGGFMFANAQTPPPVPTVAPEHDVPSDDDEEVEDDGYTAHDLVVRELGAQRLDPDA